MRRVGFFLFGLLAFVQVASAQTRDVTAATVTREPFSMLEEGADTGFSVELMDLLAAELGWSLTFDRKSSFAEMLDATANGEVDLAVANISITSERETLLDFSQPMFDSGIQIMMRAEPGAVGSTLSALFTREIGVAILLALAVLFGGGMLMWAFERRRQPYFDRGAKDAAFPAFWWALNLVVNGGFEERMPQSRPGRVFAVVLVIASLFVVSIFVAQITAALTVSAISSSVESLSDLEGREIGTVEGSTSSAFLDQRGLGHRTFAGLAETLAAFEDGRIEAVVFDGPILVYYAENAGTDARVLDRVYRPENYGIAFPSGSPLREDVDRALLAIRESGAFDALVVKWFGPAYAPR